MKEFRLIFANCIRVLANCIEPEYGNLYEMFNNWQKPRIWFAWYPIVYIKKNKKLSFVWLRRIEKNRRYGWGWERSKIFTTWDYKEIQ